jgi:superfamily II DNA helicase RecQ
MVSPSMSSLSSTPPISISTSIDSLAHRLATISMQETFGMDPWPWQSNILATLLTQKVGKPHLLVRPTGGGKSMIWDVFASTRPGSIVLSLSPLLSLSKDQTTKLETKTRRNKLVSIHLDE